NGGFSSRGSPRRERLSARRAASPPSPATTIPCEEMTCGGCLPCRTVGPEPGAAPGPNTAFGREAGPGAPHPSIRTVRVRARQEPNPVPKKRRPHLFEGGREHLGPQSEVPRKTDDRRHPRGRSGQGV